MKLDDKYSINLIIANEGNENYGDIYYSYSECREEHPDDPVIFGYEIINNKTGENASEECAAIDEWYDSVQEAFYAWSYKLKNYKRGGDKNSLLNEIDKVNDLLGIVDLKAYLDENNPNNPCIRLLDEQGVCTFGNYDYYDEDDDEDYDDEDAMYSAEEVMDRCQIFFDDTYLDGEICCNCDHNFDTYAEAEEEARETGYIAEADNIHELRKYYV